MNHSKGNMPPHQQIHRYLATWRDSWKEIRLREGVRRGQSSCRAHTTHYALRPVRHFHLWGYSNDFVPVLRCSCHLEALRFNDHPPIIVELAFQEKMVFISFGGTFPLEGVGFLVRFNRIGIVLVRDGQTCNITLTFQKRLGYYVMHDPVFRRSASIHVSYVQTVRSMQPVTGVELGLVALNAK